MPLNGRSTLMEISGDIEVKTVPEKRSSWINNSIGLDMEFFNQAIDILKILVMALGAGLAVWGVINLLEGYGSDNPAAKSQGIKQLMAN